MKYKTNLSGMTFFILGGCSFYASGAGFNTAFLQGVTGVPSVLKDNVRYPSGQYYVDIMLNGARTARMALTVSPEEESTGQLCLSPEWLKNAGIFFDNKAYEQTFDKVRGCYTLSKKKSTQLVLDMGTQTLDIQIPQAWLPEKNDAAHWDYGVNGLRVTYSGNFNKNIQQGEHNGRKDDSLDAYGRFTAALNLGRWVLSGDMDAYRNAGGSEFNPRSLTLSTAVSSIRGDLLLGRSQSQTALFSGFSLYGAALRSNSNMRPWKTRGYAPVITGVASSTSRITVSQDGYTIDSRVVPPGPWRLDDISSASNGNLVVTVEDSSGHKSVTEYPVATLPSLLRPGEYNYNVAVGQKDDGYGPGHVFSSGNGTFALASLDYGLAFTTVNMAAILHNHYQAAGLGVTQSLGVAGALSASLNASRADYDNGNSREGVSTTVKYAKSFTQRTDIQLLTYRYQSPGYTEFANWDPHERYLRPGFYGQEQGYRYAWFNGREKARYEARINHRLDNAYFSGSFWQQTYWGTQKDLLGATLSASTSVAGGVSVYLNANYARGGFYTQPDWSGSVGVSIPFTFGGVPHYSSNTVSYNRYSGTSFNNSTSATLNKRMSYTVSAGTDEQRNSTASASVSYAFDRVQTNAAVSQNRDTTTLSGSLSGSLIATPQTGVLMTKEASGTVAVLKIKDVPGVTFNGSLPTNSRGDTVIYLSEYNPTTISINPENVPDSAELLQTSYKVVPTSGAIIYRDFGYQHILRYIVRVRDAQGRILRGGNARTEQGLNAGFITSNGVLLMNLLAAPKSITVTRDNGTTCYFSAAGLKAGSSTVQETYCE